MIFRADNFTYISANMVNAITMCEVKEVTGGSEAHKVSSWRKIFPTVSCLLNLAPSASRYGSIVRFGEATTSLEDADTGQPDTQHKRVCSVALNMLARDNIY